MAKTKGKHPGGRPTKYNAAFHPLLAEVLASKGLTVDEIADKMNLARSTVALWMADKPEFSDAIKRGRQGPDDLVEKSLFERATGYVNKDAVKIFMPANADAPVYAPYEDHVAPDVTAQIFWLKNRRPDRWREKQEVEHSGTVHIVATPEDEKL